MTSTSRLLFVASVCGIAVLYAGSAFALPHHSQDYKVGKSWSEGYGDSDRDDNHWGDKKSKESYKYKKDDWGEHDAKKDWYTWGYGKEHEKWGHDKDWGWGKDPDCDPPMTHTPEPGTLLLLGSSLAAAGVAWRKRPRAMEPCE
jgi:hypothetical protein